MEKETPTMFSLEWFKQKLRKAISKSKTENLNAFEYMNIKLINDCLTVILKNGDILTKINSCKKDYLNIIKAKNMGEVERIMYSTIKEDDLISNQNLIEGFDTLQLLDDFVVEDSSTVYLKETNRTLPTLLVNKFIEIINEESQKITPLKDLQKELLKNDKYMAHKNFFLWCCLNPRAEVANELYRFIEKNSFNITKQGFIVALRNVVTLSTDTKIVEAISNFYHKTKAVWKKKPESYYLFQNEIDKEFSISLKLEIPTGLRMLGNLKDLYINLPNIAENRYTDDYTKTFDIRIGKVVSMPMKECDWSTQDCATKGLHFTSDQINYVGCGDTSVLMLINPMKIVGIGDTKGRCYEYLPIMSVSREESTKILKDLKFDTLQIEEDYAVKELENLAEEAKKGFVSESLKHSFNLPKITTIEITNIVNSLNSMKNQIKLRIVKIKK